MFRACNTLLPWLQLQVLVDDSARLQEAYPGGNAEQIAQQQAVVIENWTILQEKAAQRKDNLLAALDLYRFLTLVSLIYTSVTLENSLVCR